MVLPKGRFGLSCALATPFSAEGRVRLPAMVGHARRCLAEGCASVTLLGTTGEGASLGLAEREAVRDAFAGAGFVPERELVGGIAASSVEDAARQGRLWLEAGFRALLLPPPFYVKDPTEAGLFAWFAAVFEGLGAGARDVLLYHIPGVTGVPVSPDLVGRLREAFPEVVLGVKDSAGDWAGTAALLARHGDLTILVGDERHLAAGVRAGAGGAISGLANVLPGRLLPLARDGIDDPAVAALVEALLHHPVTPAVKALLAHGSRDPDWRLVRPPLVPLGPAEARDLGAAMDALTGRLPGPA